MDYYHERYYERLRWIRKRIAEYYWLSDKDVYYTTEYGSTPILSSRLNTAIKRLLDIFVIERIGKGTYQITEFGKQVIKAYPKLTDKDIWDIRDFLSRKVGYP